MLKDIPFDPIPLLPPLIQIPAPRALPTTSHDQIKN